jgi:hypothetical protein
VAVGIEEERLAVGGNVGDLLAIGRPLGVTAGFAGFEQLFDMEVGEVEDVQGLGIAGAEVGIAARAEGDALAVGRPGKRPDAG